MIGNAGPIVLVWVAVSAVSVLPHLTDNTWWYYPYLRWSSSYCQPSAANWPVSSTPSWRSGQKFSKLDLACACHIFAQIQIRITQACDNQHSQRPLPIQQTPTWGLGTSSVSTDNREGLLKVVVYIDDILVTGCTDEEHLEVLEQVLTRLQELCLWLKREKCTFLKSSVEYILAILWTEKVCMQPKQSGSHYLSSITKELSFLGLVNYYGKFIQNMSTITLPLNRLLYKGAPWKWTKQCHDAFQELKKQLASMKVLVMIQIFPWSLTGCDTSACGVGLWEPCYHMFSLMVLNSRLHMPPELSVKVKRAMQNWRRKQYLFWSQEIPIWLQIYFVHRP